MSLLTDAGIFLGAYLVAGRIGLVAACLLSGLSGWQTMAAVILVDYAQIPFYGVLLEVTDKYTRAPERIRQWVGRRTAKMQLWMASGKLIKHLQLSRPMMIVAVSFLPFWGFGIFSACIIAFLLKYDRLPATFLIMAGSLMGATILVALFLYPVSVFHGH